MIREKNGWKILVLVITVVLLASCENLLSDDDVGFGSGTTVTGFCGSGETVTHNVTVVSGVEYTLELSGLGADLDLELYTSSGTLVDSSRNFGTANDSITFTAESSSYEVRVRSFGGASSNYTLRLIQS